MPAKPTGNSREFLLKQLERSGRVDLLRAVADGRLSAWDAAVEAGLRKQLRDPEVDSNLAKRKAFRRHPGRARKDMEMWLGVGHEGSVFQSEEEACEYWFADRARLWPLLAVDGKRPQAWWHFESEVPYPGPDLERSTLWAANLLGEQERLEVEADWRHEFNRSFDPRFFFCAGVGLVYSGAVARHLHHRWADIPAVLVRKWYHERRRNAARIQELAAVRGVEAGECTNSPR